MNKTLLALSMALLLSAADEDLPIKKISSVAPNYKAYTLPYVVKVDFTETQGADGVSKEILQQIKQNNIFNGVVYSGQSDATLSSFLDCKYTPKLIKTNPIGSFFGDIPEYRVNTDCMISFYFKKGNFTKAYEFKKELYLQYTTKEQAQMQIDVIKPTYAQFFVYMLYKELDKDRYKIEE